MRDYGRIHSAFWQSEKVRSFTEDGRTLALYLLTSPHANLIGCYRLPDAYAGEDLQWASERVSEAFADIVGKGWASRDEGTKWVLIHNYVEWNGFENPNVAAAAHKAFDQVPFGLMKRKLARGLLSTGLHLKDAFREALENLLLTLSEPFANPEPEPEPEPIQNQSPTGARGCGTPPVGDEPPPKSARKPRTERPESASGATWDSYSAAYYDRYGVEPVRNAKVNGQLAAFVGRVGASEAPAVARFFVGHQAAFYVRGMHAVDALLKDAEKLRTEWATGRTVTQTQAQPADRTAATCSAIATLLAENAARRERQHEETPE